MKKQIGLFTAILFAVSTLMVSCSSEVHEHTFAEEWKTDENFHWKECECGEIKFDAGHTFGDWKVTKEATEEAEGSKEKSCSVCEYKVTEVIAQLIHKHVAGESWENDDKNHWKECTGCKEKIDVKEHSYSENWTKDASGHWYECVCGVKKDFEEHTYGTWNVTTEPTTTQEGKNEKTCSNCGYVVNSVVLQPAPKGFRFVKGGTVVGAKNSNNYEGVFIAGRTVTLSDFYMGKYEVTQEEYASVMKGQKVIVDEKEYELESNPSYCTKDSEKNTLFSGDLQEKRPVEGVTWYDAVWYCNALSEKKGLTKAYNIEVTEVYKASGKTGYYIHSANVTLNKNANGYRLPTEAEWEYAARGGDQTAADWNYVFSGADTAEGVSYSNDKNAGLDSVGWYLYNSINGTTGDTSPSSGKQGYGTHQVGMKASNRLGLYDMSGNVWEWCYDWYGTVNTGTETAPTGAASGSCRVGRGGSWGGDSWSGDAGNASVCCRYGASPYSRDYNRGFRVVRQAN